MKVTIIEKGKNKLIFNEENFPVGTWFFFDDDRKCGVIRIVASWSNKTAKILMFGSDYNINSIQEFGEDDSWYYEIVPTKNIEIKVN